MQIENSTIYDKELIEDGARILSRRYKYVIAVGIAALVIFGSYIVMTTGIKGNISSLLIIAAGIMFMLAIGEYRIKSYKKSLYQRLVVVNHKDNVVCKYIIDEEKIVTNTDNGSNTIYHKDIKKIYETDKQYIIVYLGNAFIFVSKNGFEDGKQSDFTKLLENGMAGGRAS